VQIRNNFALAKFTLDAKMQLYFDRKTAMRQRWIYAATLALLGAATAAHAAYVIKLKNGNEYVTTRYWQDGKQVLFDVFGGVFGVEKTFVAKIEKSLDGRLPIVKDDPPAPTGQSNSEAQKNSAENTTGTEPKPEKQRHDLNDSVVSEFNRLKDRSKEVDRLLTSEILELLKDITAFKNKLSRDSKLFVNYGQEFNGAQEVGAAVESALRSRAQ
jgi:hypothetical protein